MKKLFSWNKGFTLIELMIVIAIIAILAAILIPSFVRARAQSQLAACESNERNMGTSVEMYANDNNGNYPTAALSAAFFTPTYMRTLPVCPSNASAYAYSGTTNPSNYSISQTGNAHSAISPLSTGFPEFTSRGGLRTQ